jgi:hypothetical protein
VAAAAIEVPEELTRRASDSDARVEQLRSAFAGAELKEERYPNVTVYATGSLGRAEIGEHSDLDVFIIDCGSDEDRLRNLDRIELLAALIEASRGAGFREFSGDGQFLEVHRLEDLQTFLGTRQDEHRNVFTARMLLLMESRCLLGRGCYDQAVEQMLDMYWRDDKAGRPFVPTFLINDILRYWRVLCLSYESEEARGRDWADRRLANLKLRFNRAWLCFNALAYLLFGVVDDNAPREHARRLASRTPVERLVEIAAAVPDARRPIERLLALYADFLRQSGGTKAQNLTWVSDDGNYDRARKAGRKFGDELAELVRILGDRAGQTRFLLV